MTTTAWLDFANLLSHQDVLLFEAQAAPVDPATALPLLTDISTRKTVVGASVHWAVVTQPAGNLVLCLQTLPLPANLVPPNMTVDNTVATFLLDFPLIIEQFDGEFLSGPVPTFFCSDPVAALAALVADPRAAHAMIPRVHKRFLLMEQLDLGAVARYLRIRFCPTRGAPAFTANPYLHGPTPAKRPCLADHIPPANVLMTSVHLFERFGVVTVFQFVQVCATTYW